MTCRTDRRSTRPPSARWARRLTATVSAATVSVLLLVGTPVDRAQTSPSAPVRGATDTGFALVSAGPHPWPGHPGRRLVGYTVRRGDTATGLAVRFHAWTRELRALNHLGRRGRLFAGERITIPVVVAATRAAHVHRPVAASHRTPPAKPPHVTHPWKQADASRAEVRGVVVRTAREHHVDPHLALAVAWQESGWQQRRISSAGAVGVMQVLPGTAAWMSTYVGRPLNPYALYDNVAAGVVLIKVLNSRTGPRKAIGSYFQGLGSVQKHGLYASTKTYVRSVSALNHRLQGGWSPV